MKGTLKRGTLLGKKFWYREEPLRVYDNLFEALLGIVSPGLTSLANSYGIIHNEDKEEHS